MVPFPAVGVKVSWRKGVVYCKGSGKRVCRAIEVEKSFTSLLRSLLIRYLKEGEEAGKCSKICE